MVYTHLSVFSFYQINTKSKTITNIEIFYSSTRNLDKNKNHIKNKKKSKKTNKQTSYVTYILLVLTLIAKHNKKNQAEKKQIVIRSQLKHKKQSEKQSKISKTNKNKAKTEKEKKKQIKHFAMRLIFFNIITVVSTLF